jgi:hypothetical protein
MSSDVEDGAALVTAGLAAAEIDAMQPQALAAAHGPAHASERCANCGANLIGAYCHRCGQSGHLHRSLLHLGEEVLHGVLHFEAKAWKTLPMLVARPGLLTRRYIDGQRTRYVSPLALFLFMVFVLFFSISFTDLGHGPSLDAKSDDPAGVVSELKQNLEDSKEEVRQAQVELERARREGEDIGSAEAELAAARTAQAAAEGALQRFGTAAAQATSAIGAGKSAAPAGAEPAPVPAKPESGSKGAAAPTETKIDDAPDQWRERLARQTVDTGNPRLDATIRRQLRNPDLFLYKLKAGASKFSFLLIPISLPFLWLMFVGRRGVTVYDHAVFSLYSLSFMSLFFAVIALLAHAGVPSSYYDGVVTLVPPLHMFVQLRGTYGLGIGAALWRTVALLCVAGAAFTIFLCVIVVAAAT